VERHTRADDGNAGRAGAAIHAVHPDVLILVEGVQNSGGATYWWGGNLRGVANYKPNINPAKIVYSPHDYGPEVFAQNWFFEGSFPNNLAPLWDATWGYISKQNIGHILVGEFGIKDQTAFQGRSLTWIQTLLAYMGTTSSWTFWSLNPNSGDTGGILQDDWKTVHQWKMNLLQPYLAPQFAPAP
jgi:aryl-phospho-beta-D-glucosidase BglC (GH1 family)